MVREVGNFRKKMVVACKSLRYMDRPIFDNERACSEAWASGGYELERKVKKEWAEKKRNEEKQSLQDFRDWQAKLRKEKEEEMKNPTNETLEKRAKHQIFMEKTREEAKVEAEEEKRIFSDPDAARKAGAEHWNTSEQKDIFGNVRAKVQTPLELVEGGEGEQQVTEGGGEGEDGNNRGISKEDIFSFQGTAPGKGRAAQVKVSEFMKSEKEDEEKEQIEEKEEEEEKEKEEAKEKVDGYDSEGEREMRVAESLQLYRAQQQAKKDKKRGAANNNNSQQQQLEAKVEVTTMTTQIEAAKIEDTTKNFSKLLMDAHEAAHAERKEISTPEKRAFYWSEAMDVKLAQAVHGCMFDFAEVSKNLRGTLSEKELGDIDSSKITEATCRDRWCELDMDDSVEVANHGSKSNIVLGKDGKQMR